MIARFAPRGGTLGVDASALILFHVSPEALRDRSLGFVDEDTIDRIALTSQGRALTLVRNGEGWMAREQNLPVSTGDVSALIEAFNSARIEAFRPVADPDKTGLDTPAESITFFSWLSENSAEEPAGGHVIAKADLGTAATDNTIYARAGQTAEVATVDKELAAAVRRLMDSALKEPRAPRDD